MFLTSPASFLGAIVIFKSLKIKKFKLRESSRESRNKAKIVVVAVVAVAIVVILTQLLN